MARKDDTLNVLVMRTKSMTLRRAMPMPGTFTVQQSGARGSKVITLSRMLGVHKGRVYQEMVDLDTGVIVLKPV